MDPSWTRLRAESAFAQGNPSAALARFLEAVALQTHYFSKPLSAFGQNADCDEKTSSKMIRCLLDLRYHTYAVVLSQQLHPGHDAALSAAASAADYSVSFKNLEERTSNDAMDGLYK